MKARMRRLSASVDAAFLDHQKHSDDAIHGSSKSSDVTESRIDRVRRLISSPLSRRKSACTSSVMSSTTKIESKVFGTSLEIVAHQENPNLNVAKEPSIPFIMTRLCRYIEENNGLQLEGLFRTSGNAKLIEKLRSSFDSFGDAPLESEGDIPSAAGLLKLFLRELPEPLIPSEMHAAFITVVKVDYSLDKEGTVSQLQNLVSALPDENYYMLKYLSCFLRRVALQENRNRMNPASLGIVFGPNVFRVSTDDYKGLRQQAITNQVVALFVSDYEKIFEGRRSANLSVLARFNTLPPLHVEIPSSELDEPFITISPNLLTQTSEISMSSEIDESDLPILMVDDFSLINADTTRHRRDRKLFSLLSPVFRSSSEERRTVTSSTTLKVFEFRRCNSHEEVSPTGSDVVSRQPSPPLPEPKRRVINKPSDEQLEKSMKQEMNTNEMELANDSGICIHVTDSSEIIKDPTPDLPSSQGSADAGYFHNYEGGNPCDSFKENEYKGVNDAEANHSQVEKKSHAFSDSRSEMMDTEIRTEGLTTTNSSSTSVLRELPAFDLNTLHENADGLEPVVSEHRYSWPSLANWSSNPTMDDSSQNNPSASSYPLVQHASLQVLKKANSYEAPLSPSAYRGFLSQRVVHLDETIPPSPPVSHKEIFPSKKNSIISETAAMKDLKRKIHSLKKKLRHFEGEFEQEHGYKPSHEQKMNSPVARPLLTELNRSRKDLKDLKESRLDLKVEESPEPRWTAESVDSPLTKPRGSIDIDVDIFRQASLDGDKNELSMLNVVREIERTIGERRELFGRPEAVEEMTPDHVLAEKYDLQKLLLKYESFFGRPESRGDREIMRPLYDRYRLLKRTASRLSSKAVKKDSTDLQPILEHVQMNFSSPTNSRRNSLTSSKRPTVSSEPVKEKEKEKEENTSKSSQNNLHELPLCELMKQLQEVASEKRHLRRVIKNFEDDFQKRMGRKVEKEDRINLESVYTSYKHVKGKLRLMEALVSKTEKLQK